MGIPLVEEVKGMGIGLVMDSYTLPLPHSALVTGLYYHEIRVSTIWL